ncbi:MAG: helix-turn-helix transcriptional regulator [Veillonella caviae]|nr:helix-turn-helix transcriptional regulator [Veillonella caviae]
MINIAEEIGAKIRFLRKRNRLTIQELADAICKSKATVSKYESGHIAIDVVTLYDIAKVLNVRVEQLLYQDLQLLTPISEDLIVPAFFKGVCQLYAYCFDGRNNSLNRCVLDIINEGQSSGRFKVNFYMNIESYEHYQNCENMYIGELSHYDAISSLSVKNRDTLMETVHIHILAPYIQANEKWGLFLGISSRPIMPVAVKMLFSKTILAETAELYERLSISKEDIRLLKQYNMFTVV